MTAFLILVLAGLAGAFLRALTSTSQRTWSGQTVADTVVGGVASALAFLILGGWSVTAGSVAKLDQPAEQAAAVFVLGYGASHLFVTLIRKRLRAWMAGESAETPTP